MLRDGGRADDGERILSRPSVDLMTGDRLTDEQKAHADFILGDDGAETWGFGMGIVARRTGPATVGTYGWTGGLGSLWGNDPAEDLTYLVLTNRVWMSPNPADGRRRLHHHDLRRDRHLRAHRRRGDRCCADRTCRSAGARVASVDGGAAEQVAAEEVLARLPLEPWDLRRGRRG